MSESIADMLELAGEYVLGTLALAQRRELERRVPLEPALRAAVDEWERRLLPLTSLAAPQQPSAQLWARIERSLPMPRRVRAAGGWRGWWSSLSFWRWLAAGGYAIATLLIAVLLLRPDEPAAAPSFTVVLVAPQDKAPGWVVQVDNRRQLSLTPLAPVEVPQQKALQFWTKGQGWTGPVSLGLVRPGRAQRLALSALPQMRENQLFEIALEPDTGSLTGKPSGPVLFIGRAVKVI